MSNRPPQQVVRAGQFDRALAAMNFEMAQKTAASLAKFHGAYVAPLERRILLIETLTGIRLLRWIRWTLYRGWLWVRGKLLAGWHHFYMRFSEAIPEEFRDEAEEEKVEPEEEPPPEPEPEHDGRNRILRLEN